MSSEIAEKTGAEKASADRPGRGKPKRTERILVVDDIEDNRQLLVRRLEREGFQGIALAGDGEEALALIAAQPFDLVLLDVMMPRCDGYQVLERLKGLGRLHELPVIVISALNEIDSVVRCIELGAVDYLPKPFNPILLRARVGASLDQKRLRDQVRNHLAQLETELNAARSLQMSMVPSSFPPPTSDRPVEIFAAMEAAREVGGDLYDFFWTADGRLAFLIGDVSGKGVPAAMFMARTKNLLRVVSDFMLRDGTSGPAEILTRVNRELCDGNAQMMFVTLYLGLLDPKTGALQFCNAGHDPPYVLGGAELRETAGAHGMALGIEADWKYETSALTVSPGETLFLYTDGISEADGPDGRQFTKRGIEAVLRQAAAKAAAPDALIGAMTSVVKEFAGTIPQSDDITALALRRV